ESSVPQSQTRRRTNRNPALSADHAGAGAETGTRGGRIASTAAPEAANDTTSTTNAAPTETATSQPPSAGPASRSAIGRTNWSSEFAAARSLAGSRSGTIASKAGVKNAVPKL